MDLSLIVVNWNTSEFLSQCLESIYSCSPELEFEVWVVDNASSDGSSAMVRSLFPQVKLIQNRENVGFARANNQAICQVDARYLLLLNSDTVIKPGALEELVAFMDEHPEAGAAGSRLVNPDGSLQNSCYPHPTPSREFIRLFHLEFIKPNSSYRMERWDLDTPREVDIIQGACLIIRREARDEVGVLDESFFMYSEDVDLCYRFQKAGWKLYWVPQAVVVHYGAQSTRQIAADMFLLLYQAKLAYMRKHHGRTSAFAYKFILLGAALPRLLFIPMAWLEEPPKRQSYRSLGKNYQRLLTALPGM